MLMIQPLEILWTTAPAETKLELALNFTVEVLHVAEDNRAVVTLDDGKYEIVLNKLEGEQQQ